jgi:flagellar biosynthesis/type III secretory pathway chaperone
MGLLATCRNANETNGLIVNLKQGQIRQLLDIVRGGSAITYGPQGQTFAAAVRPLARA